MNENLSILHQEYVTSKLDSILSPLNGEFSKLMNREYQALKEKSLFDNDADAMAVCVSTCASWGYAFPKIGLIPHPLYVKCAGEILADVYLEQRFDVKQILSKQYTSGTNPYKTIKISNEEELYSILFMSMLGMEKIDPIAYVETN